MYANFFILFLRLKLPHKVGNIQLSCARPSRNLNHAFHAASSLSLSLCLGILSIAQYGYINQAAICCCCWN